MEDTSDIIFGAVVLVIILVLAYMAGRVTTNFKNKRFARAWSPLLSIVNGTVVDDYGAAASSYLTGTYKGWALQACSVPNMNESNRLTGESTHHKYNYFDISLKNISGKSDWEVEYTRSLMGFGKAEWDISSADKELEERLRKNNLVEIILAGRGHEVRFTKAQKTLVYVEDITPRWTPEPAAFTNTLEIMMRLVKLNDQINS